MSKLPQDASKRQVKFLLDEEDAIRMERYCKEQNITKQRFLSRLVLDIVGDIPLTDEECQRANEAIAARIARGYNVPAKR